MQIPNTFTLKNCIQLLFAFVCIVLAIYFVRKEWHELGDAWVLLTNAKSIPLCIGLFFTLLYIVCQTLMYVHSFKSIGKMVSFTACLRLYLKRNLASVFLPGGGVTSLAFFKDEIMQGGATKSQIYFSSVIYGFCGIFSVFVTAVPIIGYTVLKHSYGTAVYYSFAGLTGMVLALGSSAYSVYSYGVLFRFIVKYQPSFKKTIAELKEQPFNVRHFVWTNVYSFFIELIGIIHLYIAMAAIGLTPSLEAALIGYVVSVIFLTVSPFMRGLGGIEVSLVYVLGLFGVGTIEALSSTLLFRSFEFWIPLMAGIIAFVTSRRS
jgi:phosphatidylglycerol lysyltransferase